MLQKRTSMPLLVTELRELSLALMGGGTYEKHYARFVQKAADELEAGIEDRSLGEYLEPFAEWLTKDCATEGHVVATACACLSGQVPATA
ncbi:MAG: hypothetical protein J0I16_06145 [Rhizobiales bacterium]|nr:hypothetical protein [Hyphomicrobiales bacterium]